MLIGCIVPPLLIAATSPATESNIARTIGPWLPVEQLRVDPVLLDQPVNSILARTFALVTRDAQHVELAGDVAENDRALAREVMAAGATVLGFRGPSCSRGLLEAVTAQMERDEPERGRRAQQQLIRRPLRADWTSHH